MAIILTIFLLMISLSVFGQKPQQMIGRTTTERPVKVSLLGGYYDQDGDHSAVNGGRGNQELFSNTMETSIYIPVKDSSALKIDGGFDYFTSASLLSIDKYQSSASSGSSNVSGDELRTYAHVGMDIAGRKKGMLFSPTIGFSREYDVSSLNGSFAFSKNLKKRHGNYSASVSYIADRWMLVYPGEFRASATQYTSGASEYTTGASTSGTDSGSGNLAEHNGGHASDTYFYDVRDNRGSGSESSGSDSGGSEEEEEETSGGETPETPSENGETSGSGSEYYETPAVPYAAAIPVSGRTIEKDGKIYPVDMRQTLSLTNACTWIINKKANAAAGIDLTAQWGMLSTPFHRVYFDDGIQDEFYKEVRIEKLPDLRLKSAVYGRFNYSVNAYLKLRTHVRYYYDTWDVQALSVTVEAPVKATQFLTITPFYRLHLQEKSKYFAAYGQHIYRPGSFYTSDYDLSGFTAHKAGAAIRFSPLAPIAAIRNSHTMRTIFAFKTAGVRYSAYTRSDGLDAQALTFELTFEM
jgi:hypothetical protein